VSATPASSGVTVEQPGVYDLPADVYHADPVPGGSLSASGAKRLLPPSCPALYHYWSQRQEHKDAFDFGHAAHAEVLGVGAPIVVVDAKDWRTKAAQQKQADAYAAGHTPLLKADHERVQAMAAALRAHPTASALFRPGTGRAEQSLFWSDEEFGVWRRAMLDWIPNEPSPVGLLIGDYKSTPCADPGAIAKAIANYSYLQQAAWYEDAVRAVGLADDPVFLFVFQEKTPPYLVTVVQPKPYVIEWGRRLNRKALDVWRRCREADHWPGYADEVVSVGLPGWTEAQYQAAWDRGDLDVGDPT